MLSGHTTLDQWRPILTVPGVTFVNLYYGGGAEEIAAAKEAFNADIADFGGVELDLRDDLDDLYALMTALDMIVTSPSAVANMSCSLGEKCHYFYNTRSLWRTLGRDAIPWFMDANPLFFAENSEFPQATAKAGVKVEELRDRHHKWKKPR